MVNDDGSRRTDLYTALDGSGRGSTSVAVEVCSGDEPGVAGEEGSDVFSIGAEAMPYGRSTIVFADPVSA